MVLVGEQPGDSEDLAGRPFVGPAGQVLDQALEAAGLDRASLYLTNAVKHFKFEQRGKRRIHQRPQGGEINACKPWLLRELTEQMFKLRFQRATGSMENPSKMRQVRREIARIKTLLKEKSSQGAAAR